MKTTTGIEIIAGITALAAAAFVAFEYIRNTAPISITSEGSGTPAGGTPAGGTPAGGTPIGSVPVSALSTYAQSIAQGEGVTSIPATTVVNTGFVAVAPNTTLANSGLSTSNYATQLVAAIATGATPSSGTLPVMPGNAGTNGANYANSAASMPNPSATITTTANVPLNAVPVSAANANLIYESPNGTEYYYSVPSS